MTSLKCYKGSKQIYFPFYSKITRSTRKNNKIDKIKKQDRQEKITRLTRRKCSDRLKVTRNFDKHGNIFPYLLTKHTSGAAVVVLSMYGRIVST